ncbi:MAG: LysM peptidoglycan-binding domain-containing protein [Chloroflexi bacterium]|nr:LysM peptidoglycan-binding domain-containing protein [Chloroflexota bacterium]MCY3589816.1 LysM peptidoglycan-binding domain-containing protein [Chloroflexota bacterium]MCY3685938.1 LysM peptidoglycan-binding domain-containing protein [Chloroflexota bacterium]MDE2709706.1 LysM peptidoglycan-binding domain-containing protein [Chloroflexota bacterium]
MAFVVVSGWVVAGGWSRASADTYTIQAGDTLWDIANRLQVGISVLLALNEDITSPNNIYVGQRIQVPDNAAGGGSGRSRGASTPTSSTGSGSSQSEPDGSSRGPTNSGGLTIVYLVQAGDTLSEIADSYGTTVEAILLFNPGLNPNLLWVGNEITIQRGSGLGHDSGGQGSEPALNAGIQGPAPAATSMRTVQYVVEPGDSWTGIAVAAGISLADLRAYNEDADFPNLHPGDILNVPIPDYRAPALDPSESLQLLTELYTVRPGDNASQIAQRYDVTLAELRRMNGGLDLSMTFVGQTLTVPWNGVAANAAPGTVPAVEVRRRTYRVQPNDTLAGIAERHGMTLDELREQNPLKFSDLLVIGELLYLPGTIEPPVVSETRTLWEADVVQYAAAALGVTPHTLLANHSWVDTGQWLGEGSTWRLPLKDGLLVTVQPGDTLQQIANTHGIDIDLILSDPANGVDDPNAIVIGQEIILPLAMPEFSWPASGQLTDPFGQCRSWDCSYRHRGLDIALDFYEPILAAADGVVTFLGGDSLLGLGWYVEIEHEHGWRTVYAHVVEFNVSLGQTVSRGDVIAYNGSTGYSTGPHLHFEVHHNDWYVDPLVILP